MILYFFVVGERNDMFYEMMQQEADAFGEDALPLSS
jgi:hypothetical protein